MYESLLFGTICRHTRYKSVRKQILYIILHFNKEIHEGLN